MGQIGEKMKLKKWLIPSIVTLVFLPLYFYVAIPAIHWRSGGFWWMLILSALVFFGTHFCITYPGSIGEKLMALFSALDSSQKKKNARKKADYVDKTGELSLSSKTKKILLGIAIGVSVILLAVFFTSSVLFRAKEYQQMLTVEENADFAADIAELPISQIPVVDRDTAERLGSRKIGEVVELVSQFNVSSYYSQINYKNKPYRVSPLEYAGILKWLSNRNEGIPYYVTIDMASQETKLVELDEGMKYSPSEFFGRDLYRHIRFAYPTKMFDDVSFEIDEDGHPYWVMSYYDYTFGILGGKDIVGVILVDAVTGEMTDYPVADVPKWIDQVYNADLLVEQADNWGSLKRGFLNSIFVQKEVVVTTNGYNYIANDDDVWLYTGITSVVADESNIGFILINMRTKEAKTYMINGAEEYSAMASAEGQVQEKGYTATFPILINVEDKPSYFLSLKDNAGLVKCYAFVSVSDYQIVGVADTIEDAKSAYLRMLGVDKPTPSPDDVFSATGTVEAIATAVRDGNTYYYLKINGALYIASIKISDLLPFIKVGDTLDFTANGTDGTVYSLNYTTQGE